MSAPKTEPLDHDATDADAEEDYSGKDSQDEHGRESDSEDHSEGHSEDLAETESADERAYSEDETDDDDLDYRFSVILRKGKLCEHAEHKVATLSIDVQTELKYGIDFNHIPVIEAAIMRGADLNDLKLPSLYWAAIDDDNTQTGTFDTMQLLLQHKASVNAKCKDGNTALQEICERIFYRGDDRKETKQVLRLLLDHKANVEDIRQAYLSDQKNTRHRGDAAHRSYVQREQHKLIKFLPELQSLPPKWWFPKHLQTITEDMLP